MHRATVVCQMRGSCWPAHYCSCWPAQPRVAAGQLQAGPSVFDLSVSGRRGASEVAGGRAKTKTENRFAGAGAGHEKAKTYPLGP